MIWLNFLQLPLYMIYTNCIFIILTVLLSSEKSIIDSFAEQYGNHKTPRTEIILNRFLTFLVFILFYNSYIYLSLLYAT